jgi:hypothetical protein
MSVAVAVAAGVAVGLSLLVSSPDAAAALAGLLTSGRYIV